MRIGIRLDMEETRRGRAMYALRTMLSPYEAEVVEGTDRTVKWKDVSDVFRILSREEEREEGARDRHGRFPFSRCGHGMEGVWDPPPVWKRADALAGEWNLKRREWSGGAKFVVGLTHDVDRVRGLESGEGRGLLRRAAWHLIRKGRPVESWRALSEWVGRRFGRNRWNDWKDWVEGERKRECISTWFFSAGGNDPFDNSYRPGEDPARGMIRGLVEKGFEIGLHRSISCDDVAAERESLRRISGCAVEGNRCHYLALDVVRDWRRFEESGLLWDATLGFPEREGFRAGWPFPHQPWDFGKEAPSGILGIPLMIMDTTLIDYRKLDPESGWKAIEKQLDTLEAAGGAGTVLWHNGSPRPWKELWFRMIDRVRERGGACVSAGRLAEWWRDMTERGD